MLEPGAIPAPLRPEAASATAATGSRNTGDADQRDVVFGGQFLAQAIVASSLRPSRQGRPLDPGRLRPPRPRSTRTPSSRSTRCTTAARSPATPSPRGRAIACARASCVLDADEPDVIRHDVTMPRVAGPDAARRPTQAALVYPGSELRIVDGVDLWSSTRPWARPRRFLWTKAPVRSPTIPRCTAPCSRGRPTVS